MIGPDVVALQSSKDERADGRTAQLTQVTKADPPMAFGIERGRLRSENGPFIKSDYAALWGKTRSL